MMVSRDVITAEEQRTDTIQHQPAYAKTETESHIYAIILRRIGQNFSLECFSDL